MKQTSPRTGQLTVRVTRAELAALRRWSSDDDISLSRVISMLVARETLRRGQIQRRAA